MGFLDGLTTTQKMVGAGALGVGALFLFSRGGSGQPGVAVVDVRRPTDDMNTPGAAWGGDGYQYFAEINRSNNELLRGIWDKQNPGPITKVPDSGVTPVKPVTPGPITPIPNPWDRRSLISDLQQRSRVNNLVIRQMREDGVTGREKARIGFLRGRNATLSERLDELGAPPPMRDPNAPGPPTPRPLKGEVVR